MSNQQKVEKLQKGESKLRRDVSDIMRRLDILQNELQLRPQKRTKVDNIVELREQLRFAEEQLQNETRRRRHQVLW